jgi:hypothetical protein
MMLLDTHAIIWLASDQDRLTEKGRELIRVMLASCMSLLCLHGRFPYCINEIVCNCQWSLRNMAISGIPNR